MMIYLMRHGETEWNKAGRLQGQSDIPLNEFGIELAKKTAEGLKDVSFDAVFSSPLCRALETAEIIMSGRAGIVTAGGIESASGSRAVMVETDDRLKEIHFGAYEGKSFGVGQPNGTHPLARPESYVPVGGGESLGEAKARARAFLEDRLLPLEGKADNILIVAHGAINRCILSVISDIPDREFWKISLPNCAVSVLLLEGGQFRILEESKVYYDRTI